MGLFVAKKIATTCFGWVSAGENFVGVSSLQMGTGYTWKQLPDGSYFVQTETPREWRRAIIAALGEILAPVCEHLEVLPPAPRWVKAMPLPYAVVEHLDDPRMAVLFDKIEATIHDRRIMPITTKEFEAWLERVHGGAFEELFDEAERLAAVIAAEEILE